MGVGMKNIKQNMSNDSNIRASKKETVKAIRQEEFLELEGVLVVKPVRVGEWDDFTGWALSRNGISLERNRGGVRTFKMLCSVASFCIEHGIDKFEIEGL